MSSLKTHMKLQKSEEWAVNPHWVLDSRRRLYGEPVFKFCFSPTTNRIWLGWGRQTHKEILNLKSGRKLDSVVRGVYFRKQGIIYLRDHVRKDWLMRTERVLRANGMPKDHRVLWGWYAAKQLDELLEGL